jgi:hypothetical protein
MRTRFRKLIRGLHRGSLHLVPSTGANVPERQGRGSDSIVNAFNEIEAHLEEMRDAGQRLALASASLRNSAKRLSPPVHRRAAAAASGAGRDESARAHLRLLKTVA